MHVALVEQAAPDGLTRAALKQHIIRHDDGRAATNGQQTVDVLDEVELFVARGHPEVVALVRIVIAGNPAELIDGTEAGFPAERRICQHQCRMLARRLGERIPHLDKFRTVGLSDAM
jgi:hypothetical protein